MDVHQLSCAIMKSRALSSIHLYPPLLLTLVSCRQHALLSCLWISGVLVNILSLSSFINRFRETSLDDVDNQTSFALSLVISALEFYCSFFLSFFLFISAIFLCSHNLRWTSINFHALLSNHNPRALEFCKKKKKWQMPYDWAKKLCKCPGGII